VPSYGIWIYLGVINKCVSKGKIYGLTLPEVQALVDK